MLMRCSKNNPLFIFYSNSEESGNNNKIEFSAGFAVSRRNWLARNFHFIKLMILIIPGLLVFSGNLFAQYPVKILSNVIQPVSPYLPQIQADISGNHNSQLNQDISSHITISLTNVSASQLHIKLIGSIERVSPSPMGVAVRSTYQPSNPIILNPMQMLQLNQSIINDAFGNFTDNALIYTNTSLAQLKENGVDYKLPEGTYRICFTAYDYDQPGFSAPLSIPGSGCAYFTICYQVAAPQIIAPVTSQTQFETDASNLSLLQTGRITKNKTAGFGGNDGFQILTPKTSQIRFAWTPSTTTCGLPLGALSYNLEIRQVFDGQTLQDALYNPYVFQKQDIPTTFFLLDTLRYMHVLVNGKKYVVRVKANFTPTPGSPLIIDNQGYSQLGGFIYQTRSSETSSSTATNTTHADTTKVKATPITLGACLSNSTVSNKTALDYRIQLKGKTVKVGDFKMHVDSIQLNNDTTYQGSGYITWEPFGHSLKLAVRFDKIRINSDTAVYFGGVVTHMDHSLPKWERLSSTPSIVDTLKSVTDSNMTDADYEQLENYVTDASHLLNEISGTDPIGFPVGLNSESAGSALSNTTLAIMGVTFAPGGTSMNVLFNLNIPEANGWLSLAGSCFQITPTGFSFTNGMLYLPNDRFMSWNGNRFTFLGCKYQNLSNVVDTSKGTYLQWDKDGLKRIEAKAVLTLDTTAIVPVDSNDNIMVGKADTIRLNFSFTDWTDWLASIVPDHKFEIKSLPGFPISISDGFAYDHSVKRDPSGLQYPEEYTDHPTGKTFEGLYIKDLSMEMPPDFTTFSGDKPSFGFQNFIINGDGFTTTIYAHDILDLQTGDLGGWAFSVDTFQVGFIKSNPLTEGFKMVGKIKVPISQTDSFKYRCQLNAGTASTGGGINYLFSILPKDTINMSLWVARLALDPNSNFTINKDNLGMAIGATLNGNIGISSNSPKISFTALRFQGLSVGNRNTTGGTSHAGFNFSAGNWSLGGTSSHPNSASNGSTSGSHTGSTSTSGSTASNSSTSGSSSGSGANSGSSSSQSSADSFAINLSNFTPSFQTISSTQYEAGITFDVNVNVGFGKASLISGGSKIGVFGKIAVPGDHSPEVSFDKIKLDSVSLNGKIGPISVKGYLAFLDHDSIYGSGVNGMLQATFPFATLAAGARFGTVDGYHYFAVAGSAYMPSGIQCGPVVFNGFGGGLAWNMQIAQVDPNKISRPPSADNILPKVNLTPHEGDFVLTAQVFLALFRPQTLNANVALSADFNTSGGLSLVELSLDGAGYLLSSDPPDNHKFLVSVDPMHIDYNFVDKSFDANLQGNLKFNKITATVPIDIHSDTTHTDFFYLGKPTDPAVIHILNIGKPTDNLYVKLVASSYFDAGSVLPVFPGLPDEITSHLNTLPAGSDANPQSDYNTVEAMVREMGNSGNQGFLMGANVTGNIKLGYSSYYAKADATLGYDVALQHVDPANIPQSCLQSDGTFGFSNWYAFGQVYAYLGLEVGIHANLALAKGDYDLLNGDVLALLQAGMPNPTWMKGQVRVDASILGGSIQYHGNFPIDVGNQCTIHINPFDGLKLITDAGPKDNAGVFDKPFAVFSLPMDGRNFPILEAPDNDHKDAYTRTFHFLVDQFNLYKVNSSGSDSLIAGHTDIDSTGKAFTLFRDDMLDPHTQYKVHIHCFAQEFLNGSWGEPAEGPLSADTTLLFTTGDAPKTIAAQNVVYTYPIDGQQFLLKNEFSNNGIIKMGNWQSNLFPQPDPAHGIASYNYELKFIPESGGDTITTAFSPNESAKSITYQIPASLQNSTIYRMEARVLPQMVQVNGVASNNQLSLHQVQSVNTQQQTTTTIQQGANHSLVQSQQTQQTQVQVNTQQATNKPQVINVEPDPIYTIRFRTSQFNTFAQKMASYSSFSETDYGYPNNYSIVKSTVPGTEGFDEFELGGYISMNTTAEGLTGAHFKPLFHAYIPFDASHTSDISFDNNIYTPISQLMADASTNGVPKFTVDLGDSTKRDFTNSSGHLGYPEFTVTNATPAIPGLTPPSPGNSSTSGSNSDNSNNGGGGTSGALLIAGGHLNYPNGIGGGGYQTVLLPGSSSYGGGMMANQQDGHQSGGSAYSSSAPSPPPPPDPTLLTFNWNRYAYVDADLSLLKQFSTQILNSYNVLNNFYPNENGNFAIIPAGNEGSTIATGTFGSISVYHNYIWSIYGTDQAVNIANHFNNFNLYGYGDSGNRNIKFVYELPWCIFCGAQTTSGHIN